MVIIPSNKLREVRDKIQKTVQSSKIELKFFDPSSLDVVYDDPSLMFDQICGMNGNAFGKSILLTSPVSQQVWDYFIKTKSIGVMSTLPNVLHDVVALGYSVFIPVNYDDSKFIQKVQNKIVAKTNILQSRINKKNIHNAQLGINDRFHNHLYILSEHITRSADSVKYHSS